MKRSRPISFDLRIISQEPVLLVEGENVGNKAKEYTVCASPQGISTSKNYSYYLGSKEDFELFFSFVETMPNMCLADLHHFNFKLLDRYVRQLIRVAIRDNDGCDVDFFVGGERPFTTVKNDDVRYSYLLRYVKEKVVELVTMRMHVGVCVDEAVFLDLQHRVHVYESILTKAELEYIHCLSERKFPIKDIEGFRKDLRKENEAYLEDQSMKDTNVSAYLFTDMLSEDVHSNFLEGADTSDMPMEKVRVMSDYEALAKKVLILKALRERMRDGYIRNFWRSRNAASFLIESFMKERVEEERDVAFGSLTTTIPGKIPSKQPTLQLLQENKDIFI